MKPALTKDNTTLYHYRNGVRSEGKNFFMRGDCSRLTKKFQNYRKNQ